MAAYVELYLDQGSTFNNVINITDDTTNEPVNLTGYTVSSQMRRSYYSTSPTANITCEVTAAVLGEVTMSMSANTTSTIKAGRYLFDVETRSPSGVVNRILEGIITITPGVTR